MMMMNSLSDVKMISYWRDLFSRNDAMERHMLGISLKDRKKNEWIRKRTSDRKLKWQWEYCTNGRWSLDKRNPGLWYEKGVKKATWQMGR